MGRMRRLLLESGGAPALRLALATTGLFLLLAGGSQAAVLTAKTTSDDITPNDGSVSLREAITSINAGNDLGDPDITAQSPGAFGTDDMIHIASNRIVLFYSLP